MDNAKARAALTHVSKAVDSRRREYIMSCLLRIKEGEDPLERMCAAGHDDQTEMMQFLIGECRGDVNYKNEKGRTQLHTAARSGYPETVKLFLKYARDVDAHDNDGMTPLMCCAEAGREFVSYEKDGRTMYGPYGKPDGHIETIRVLMRAGADVTPGITRGPLRRRSQQRRSSRILSRRLVPVDPARRQKLLQPRSRRGPRNPPPRPRAPPQSRVNMRRRDPKTKSRVGSFGGCSGSDTGHCSAPDILT